MSDHTRAVRYTIAILAGLAALILGSLIGVVATIRYSDSSFDTSDRDYQTLDRLIGTRRPTVESPRSVDFSDINGGDWTVLCVVGAYTKPQQVVSRYVAGERLAVSVPELIDDPYKRSFEHVEEHEGAIVYLTRDGSAKIVHFPGFELLAAQHGADCTVRSKPVLTIPANKPGHAIKPARD